MRVLAEKQDYRILAIDPGTTESAYVSYMNGDFHAEKVTNAELLELVRGLVYCDVIVIEMIASYGMAVGAEVFETCTWIGRFEEAAKVPTVRMFRREVKLNLCNSPRANDSNIRAAIIDRFGGKEVAIGRKSSPGPLYGITADRWAALAVALTFLDREVA
jgi:hypothetical protein